MSSRVAFLLWTGLPGGAERHTVDVCTRLRLDHAVDSRIVFIGTAGGLGPRLENARAPFVELGYGSGLAMTASPHRLTHALRSFDPHVVVASGYGFESLALVNSGWARHTVVVEHGGILASPLMARMGRRAVYRLARRLNSRRVSGEVYLSRFMLKSQMAAPHAARLFYAPNGVDTDRYRPRQETRGPHSLGSEKCIVGAAGRMVEEKGFLSLLQAVAQAGLEYGARIRLLLAGEGPLLPDLKSLAQRLGMGDSVAFLGQVEDMAHFYNSLDVMCVPSSSRCQESFSLVCAEAQASGVPVIATRVGALPEVVVDGTTGCIVSADDTAQLAAALALYAGDAALRALQGKSARDWARRRLSLARTAQEYMRLVRCVSANRGKHAYGD